MTYNRAITLAKKRKTFRGLEAEVKALQFRLEEAQAVIEALRTGTVDSVVVPGENGDKIYTLKGADRAYRTLLEGLNEGALTLSPDGTILYCNSRFSEMAKVPVESLLGTPMRSVLFPADRKSFTALLRQPADSPVRHEFSIRAADGSSLPSIFSIKYLDLEGMMVHCAVVTDINERIKSEDVVRRSEQHFRDLYDEGERTREELQRLSREMLRVQEAERTRISREIHDELGQMLTAISLNVNNIAKTVPSSLLKRDIQSVRQLLEQATDFIHRLSHQIHPGMLEDLGLVPALRYLLRSLKESAGMDVKLIVLGAAGKASLEQKAAMYRVAQESLTNVLKHAGTSRASVTVRNSAEAIELQVLDKGKGFTLSRMSGSEGTRLGLGLVGMRERVQSLGGMFVIRSRPGKGTSVRVRIPFDGRKHGRRTGS